MLHPDSPLGDTIPECYTCGSRNPFMLGFLPAKGDAVVMLLCRTPCNYAANTKEVEWDASQWSPLIENRSFLSWFVHIPSAALQRKARAITAQQISKLEDLWRENERATLGDIENPALEEDLPKTQVQYDSIVQYNSIFFALLSAEEEYDKKLKEGLTQHDLTLRWESDKTGNLLVWLRLPPLESGELRLSIGDELCLRYKGTLTPSWHVNVVVQRFSPTSSMEVACEVPRNTLPPSLDCVSNFSLEIVWIGTTYRRMKAALHRFLRNSSCMSPNLQKKLLGHTGGVDTLKVTLPSHIAAPGLPELNHSQVAAVKAASTRALTLIQGPPGTGKTVTSATIAYHLARQHRGKVLVCAPSNIPVDQLAEKMHMCGLKVVRLFSRTRETISSHVSFLAMHEQVLQLNSSNDAFMALDTKRRNGELSKKDAERLKNVVRRAEKEILDAADVICTTCSSSADPRLRTYDFAAVLVDEATQAVEPECLIPIVRGCRQLVLVGDHQQLGPVVMNRKVAAAGMNLSLFERLVLLGHQPRRLEVQYRMHPCLSEFPSNMFYDGMLQNGVTAQQRLRKNVSIPWPVPTMPMMFYQNLGQEEISASGTSFLNRTEASSVEKLATLLLKAGIEPEEIGVVTPYEGQRNFLINYLQIHGSMNKDLYRRMEVASVDAFQGREKDYILVSCVRSNDRAGIGFLGDPRRLNVALTRARYGLVVVGNPRVLCKDPLWYHLLVHFKERQVLVEGALSNLQTSMIQFGRPPKEKKRATPMQRMRDATAADEDALAIDPVRAPFRGREPGSNPLWQPNAKLSYNQSDRLLRPGADDAADMESLDGYESQASMDDDFDTFGAFAPSAAPSAPVRSSFTPFA